MKKIYKYLLIFSLSILFLIGNKTNAYAASASLTGNSTVRAGDTITLSLNISDNGKYGLEGNLNYDSSVVTFSNVSCNLSGWKVEHNGGSLLVYDDALANPLNGNKSVLTMTFKVNNNVAPGTNINISISNLVASDGSAESTLGTATYSVAVARPLSSNVNLSSLSVEGFSLTPGFSSGTTTYDIGEVEYSTSSLNISYKTEDANAKASISGNSLNVGANTVSVTVKAENGSTKTYKINVTRKQDPNYVASSNANLDSISVNQGMISPQFSSDVTDYVVYLPYECAGMAFSATGNAADGKAQSVASGEIAQLVEGVNKTVITCKAEDGTEKQYSLSVIIMPKYAGVLPTITGIEVEEEPDEVIDSTELSTETEEIPTEDTDDSSGNNNVPIIAIVVLIVIATIVSYIVVKRNKVNL